MTIRQQQFRSRLEFSSSEEWRHYVETRVPEGERDFVIAFGLTALYVRFHEVRDIRIPKDLLEALTKVKTLGEPKRTAELNTLNARLFDGMSRFLFANLSSVPTPRTEENADTIIAEVVTGLERENASFALWSSYERAQRKGSHLPTWEQYVQALLASEEPHSIEFTLSMGALGQLLSQLSEQRKTISPLLINRIRALHREREGQERNLAARMVLQELLEAVTPCTSA